MRRTYIYDKQLKKIVEITPRIQTIKNNIMVSDSHYDGLRATDGTDISTRKKHRDYMKRHGLTTADDYKDSWSKKKIERENYYQKGGTITRDHICRVIHQLENK
jgi:uncharacterized protein (UPF0262 family)